MVAEHGSLVPFELTFQGRSAEDQARLILAEARHRIAAGAFGVGITYSANLDQTVRIRQIYAAGGWHTATGGANQAAVMTALELLEEAEFADLQHRLRIVPLTTMSYGALPAGTTMDDVVVADLAAVRQLIDEGWTVLGWINEVGGEQFAVGGGIAKQYHVDNPDRALSPAQSAIIQAELHRLARTTAPNARVVAGA